jgi:alpha-L-fucosidase
MRDTSWFTQGRLGLMLHRGLYSVIGIEASWPLVQGQISYAEYEALAGSFKPARYDPAAWARTAREAGATYVVLTTKHHDGFALWDTQYSDFSAPRQAAGRDLIAPYVEALREEGLRVGLYFSLPDWHTPDYPVTPTPLGTRPEKAWPPNAYMSIAEAPERWQRYLNFMHGQLRELLTNYGRIDLIWFDGGWEHSREEWQAVDLVKMVRSLQPDVVINDRICPDLRGVATTVDPDVADYIQCEMALPAPQTHDPWERAISINDSWSYKPSDTHYKSSAVLIRYLAETVGQNGTLLLDVGPSADGDIQGEFTSRLRVVGDWLRRHGESIYGAGAGPAQMSSLGPATANGDLLYVHVLGAPPEDTVEVRGLSRRVLEGSLLDSGRPLEWEQQVDVYFGSFLRVHLPPAYRDPHDTVIALRLAPE